MHSYGLIINSNVLKNSLNSPIPAVSRSSRCAAELCGRRGNAVDRANYSKLGVIDMFTMRILSNSDGR